MSETSTRPTVAELLALDVPHFDWRTLAEGNGFDPTLTAIYEKELDEYFKDFAKPELIQQADSRYQHWRCLCCRREIMNDWDLAHGEASCRQDGCGYPSRLYHYKVPGQPGRVVLGLQYHPSALRKPDSQEEES